MKKQVEKYLMGVAIVIVVIVGVQVITSSASRVEPVEDAELTISETRWNLGDVPMSEGIATHEITLKNDSAAPITITHMETSCMCTTAQIVHSDGSKSGLKGMAGHGGNSSLSETIQAGEIATLIVKFDPNAHGPNGTGPITRNVELETNSATQPNVVLTFSGNVVK